MPPSKKFYPGKRPGFKTLSGKAASSTRQAKAKGISPSNPHYGIMRGGSSSRQKLMAKASRLFGTKGRNVPSGQGQLSGKAKRQVQ